MCDNYSYILAKTDVQLVKYTNCKKESRVCKEDTTRRKRILM